MPQSDNANQDVDWQAVEQELRGAVERGQEMELFSVCANLEIFLLVGSRSFPEQLFQIVVSLIRSEQFRAHSEKLCVLGLLCRFMDIMSATQRQRIAAELTELYPLLDDSASVQQVSEILSKLSVIEK